MSNAGDNETTSGDLREMADKGIEKVRGALGSFLEKARSGAESLQKATQTAHLPEGMAFSRGLEFAEKNVAAAFEHAQKLVRVTDIKEAMTLSSEYIQAQATALKEQAEELTGLSQKKPEAASDETSKKP